MGENYTRTQHDLYRLYYEQVDFIDASSQAYDAGSLHEAKRLAAHLRVLLHHAGTSHALLEQMGVRTTITWLASGPPIDPCNLLTEHTLVHMRMENYPPAPLRGTFVPILAGGRSEPRVLPFDHWWREPVIRDDRRSLYTREQIVRQVANKDGGAHIDPVVPLDHHNLTTGRSVGWVIGSDDSEETRIMDTLVGATVRQIAAETLGSLRRAGLLGGQ